MSEHHIYKFNVTMTCGGCSGAVERVLKKLDGRISLYADSSAQAHRLGVDKFDVSLTEQTVIVEGSVPYDDVLATIKKTGKTVNSGETIS